MDWELHTYYPIFLYLAFILAFGAAALTVTHLIGPAKRTPVKDMPYESGMDPIGDTRQRFDVKFYLIAILFLVFDVELLFLYPWAVNHATMPLYTILKAALFMGILVFGLAYAWRKRALEWR